MLEVQSLYCSNRIVTIFETNFEQITVWPIHPYPVQLGHTLRTPGAFRLRTRTNHVRSLRCHGAPFMHSTIHRTELPSAVKSAAKSVRTSDATDVTTLMDWWTMGRHPASSTSAGQWRHSTLWNFNESAALTVSTFDWKRTYVVSSVERLLLLLLQQTTLRANEMMRLMTSLPLIKMMILYRQWCIALGQDVLDRHIVALFCW